MNPVRFHWAGFLRSNSAREPLPSFQGPGFMGLALWPIFQRGPRPSLNLGARVLWGWIYGPYFSVVLGVPLISGNRWASLAEQRRKQG
ncbi:hypothetical protein CDAR_551571 [Caerostris darwini]|uniref:Uncharacterized protein n=1 Tax=Caerostris darwini TaxID=1538125 RepID=A0AAV4V5X0_9ARAC|nr:hypothetical protein CDAR_551571 [Caerostris darwini]